MRENLLNKMNGKYSGKKGMFEVFNFGSDTTTINLFGPVFENPPEDHEGDYIALSEVRKEIADINTSKILVKINTSGGSFFAGQAIASLLREHSAEITTRIIGIAASAGSIIFTAGENREIYKSGSLLIHLVRSFVYGTAEQLENAAADIRELDKSLMENYKEMFNGSDKELKKLLEADKYMTAAEAKERGFCTKIIDKKAKSDDEEENRNQRVVSQFKKSGKSKAKKKGNLLSKMSGGKK